jgi:hypothetical protein
MWERSILGCTCWRGYTRESVNELMPNLDFRPKYFGLQTKKLGGGGPVVKLAFCEIGVTQ